MRRSTTAVRPTPVEALWTPTTCPAHRRDKTSKRVPIHEKIHLLCYLSLPRVCENWHSVNACPPGPSQTPPTPLPSASPIMGTRRTQGQKQSGDQWRPVARCVSAPVACLAVLPGRLRPSAPRVWSARPLGLARTTRVRLALTYCARFRLRARVCGRKKGGCCARARLRRSRNPTPGTETTELGASRTPTARTELRRDTAWARAPMRGELRLSSSSPLGGGPRGGRKLPAHCAVGAGNRSREEVPTRPVAREAWPGDDGRPDELDCANHPTAAPRCAGRSRRRVRR